MQYVVVALMVLAIPLFFGLPSRDGTRRNVALMAIGLLCFVGGTIQSEAAIISWPLWAGPSRGFVLGPRDVLAALLVFTRRNPLTGMPLTWLVALYGASVSVSIFLAAVPMATAFAIWQLARSGLLFFAVAGEFGRRGAMTALLKGLSLGLILQAFYVVNQKLHGVVQASGTFPHQNQLGMMVTLALLPLASVILEGERSRLIKFGAFAGMVIIVGGGSRGTMGISAAALVILAIASLLRRRTNLKMRMLGMGLLALVIVVPAGFLTLKERFGGGSMITQEEQRAAFERAAREISSDHPFGIGANQFANVSNLGGYAARAGVAWNYYNRSAPVHNVYLLARAETGWAGQGILFLLLVVPIIVGTRAAFANRSSYGGGLVLGSTIAILAIAIHGNFEYAVAMFPVQALLLANIGFVSGQLKAGAKRPKSTRTRRKKALVVNDNAAATLLSAADKAS